MPKNNLAAFSPEAAEAARESRIRSAIRRAGYRLTELRRTGLFAVLDPEGAHRGMPMIVDANLDLVDAWLAA